MTQIMPKIELTEPSANRPFTPGHLINIRWKNIVAGPERLRLVLKKNGIHFRDISSSTGVINKGHYRWKVPTDIRPGLYVITIETMDKKPIVQVPIRIIKLESHSSTGLNFSSFQSIRIIKPSSSEQWISGETRTIQWSTKNNNQRLRIYLQKGAKQTAITSALGVVALAASVGGFPLLWREAVNIPSRLRPWTAR